jgi:NADH-quinone oxidoreductase subunit M
MLSHGIVSGGLFLMVGFLYDRYHSRLLYYYNGMIHYMPIFATVFFILT